jgi:hypothetical protein
MIYTDDIDDLVHERRREKKLDFYRKALMSDGLDIDTVETFISYHKANPSVWQWFKKFAFEAIDRGKKVGAKAIFERIRWEVEITTTGEVKLNNNFPAYYARIFSIRFPQHKDFFETRKVTGLKEVA